MDDDVPMGEGTPKWKPEEFWLRCVSGTTSTILLEIYRASCETDERFVWEVLMEGFLTVGNEGKQELVETEIKYVLENPNPGHRCWSVLETQISEELVSQSAPCYSKRTGFNPKWWFSTRKKRRKIA